jgi:hyperosmotically inducible protein
MNSESSRKIIVASGMAVVVGVIAVTFALRSPHPTSVAQISQPPAAAQIPDAPTPEAPAAVAPIPDSSAAVAANDNVGAKIGDTSSSAASAPKLASTGADTTDHTVAPEAAVNSHKKHSGETLAKGVDRAKSVDGLTMPSATSRSAADAQEGATSNEPAGSDSRITTELKSQLAADSISKDVDIGVTTTQGVVVLTGTLVTQDAIDHVKDVAEKVKDVKSVDISAMKITST